MPYVLAGHETGVVVGHIVCPTHGVVDVGAVAGGGGGALTRPLIDKLGFTENEVHVYTCTRAYTYTMQFSFYLHIIHAFFRKKNILNHAVFYNISVTIVFYLRKHVSLLISFRLSIFY